MIKILMKNKVLFFCMFFVCVNNARSADFYSSPSANSPVYWNKCISASDFQGRYVQNFKGQAKSDLLNIVGTHIDNVMKPILINELNARDDFLNSLANLENTFSITMQDAYQALSMAETNMHKKSLEAEMEYLKTLSQQGINEEMYGFYSTGNSLNRPLKKDAVDVSEDSNSSQYRMFKSMCKRNKMVSKLNSSGTALNKNQSLHNLESKINSQNTRVTSATQKSYEVVKNHYDKYCTVKDIENGICNNNDLKVCDEGSGDNLSKYVCKEGESLTKDETFNLANADLSSFNFMSPEYKIDNESKKKLIMEEGFKPNYTYNEEQRLAALGYINNMVFASVAETPSLKDRNDPSESIYIEAYESHLASLNLAYQSYLQSMSVRTDITGVGSEIPMSELDVMKYILNNIDNPDAVAASNDSNKKSKNVLIYSMMTINNKLELEILKKKERIRVILAALLAKEANSPYNIEQLNSVK